MRKTNAKQEFLAHIPKDRYVHCASIFHGDDYSLDEQRKIILKVDYSTSDYELFLFNLDFMYDSGYGGQELFGTIWYTDGTWSTRGEYDGSEWWELHDLPDIPEYLR